MSLNHGLLLSGIAAAFFFAVLLLAWRLVERARDAAEAQRLLHTEQLQQLTLQLQSMGQQLHNAHSQARADAEEQKAQALQVYAGHLTSMQAQMRDVLGITQKQLDSGRQSTEERLSRVSSDLTTQLGAHREVILAVQGQLGALGEAAKGMHALGKDIASLQDILRAPKLRGNLGELLLTEILRQVLPSDAFAMQHRFAGDNDGDEGPVIVDAVIHLGDRMVPIDSKFPLESFQRLYAQQAEGLDGADDDGARNKRRKLFLDVVRKHIDVVAKKYIRPERGTYDFAIVYLPAENVYYEAVVRAEENEPASISAYAAQKHVMVVSPSTLYAYLLTVCYGLRGMRIEQQAEHIRRDLAGFHKKFAAFYLSLEKSHKNLSLAHKFQEEAIKRGGKLNDQVGRITGAAIDLDALGPGTAAGSAALTAAADDD